MNQLKPCVLLTRIKTVQWTHRGPKSLQQWPAIPAAKDRSLSDLDSNQPRQCLPGENLHSFGQGFDLLYSLGPQEIQVGLLKRLRGTPIARHTQAFDMRYMSTPPYRILAHRDADFGTVQRMVRFARYWDLIGNSGRFPSTLPILLGECPFKHFLALSDWLYDTTAQTHRIALPRPFELLHGFMTNVQGADAEDVAAALLADFRHNGQKGIPAFARQATDTMLQVSAAQDSRPGAQVMADTGGPRMAQRQRRHQ